MAETQPVITQYLAEHNFKLPDIEIPNFAVKKSVKKNYLIIGTFFFFIEYVLIVA